MRLGLIGLLGTAAFLGGCNELPGKPPPNPAPVIPANTSAGFEAIYAERCAGCHGNNGVLGAARPMRDADYLQSIPRETLFKVTRNGVPGTRMPQMGGDTVDPIPDDVLHKFIEGMVDTWGTLKPDEPRPSRGIAWKHVPGSGDASRGAAIFEAKCAYCHPAQMKASTAYDLDRPGTVADPLVVGSVVDPFYLRLVSDQHLRSSVVYGRADLGMPGAAGPFRGPDGKEVSEPLDAEAVADLVAYMVSFRDQWPTEAEKKDGAP